jgi:FeS assembly SUF system regulator
MIRLSKLTDYGLVLMSQIARSPATDIHTARDLSVQSGLPLPTVSKILKSLLQSGLLVSHRGIKGGYGLVREPNLISITEIIAAIEGPLALTDCSRDGEGVCEIESSCAIKDNQRVINQVVRGALESVTLSDLLRPMHAPEITHKQTLIPATSLTPGRMQ